MKHRPAFTTPILTVAFVAAIVGSLGCPRPGNDDNSYVIATLGSTGTLSGDLAADAVASLVVSVREIYMELPASGGGVPAQVGIFSGDMDVDLLHLGGLSAVIADAEIEAGNYSKLTLVLDNPRLYLAAAPTVAVNVSLAGGGVVTVNQLFQVSGNADGIVELELDSLGFASDGSGGYVLTPHLQANANLATTNAVTVATVTARNLAQNRLTVETETGVVLTVHYEGATLIHDVGIGTVPITESDLFVGANVQVEGALHSDASIDATLVTLLGTPIR